jgi:hypothetical protein
MESIRYRGVIYGIYVTDWGKCFLKNCKERCYCDNGSDEKVNEEDSDEDSKF